MKNKITNLRELEEAQARLDNRLRAKRTELEHDVAMIRSFYSPVKVVSRATSQLLSFVDWKALALAGITGLRKKLKKKI